MGARCEGRVAPLMLEQGVGGSVARGAWNFLSLTLGDEDDSWRKVRRSRSMISRTRNLAQLHSWPSMHTVLPTMAACSYPATRVAS